MSKTGLDLGDFAMAPRRKQVGDINRSLASPARTFDAAVLGASPRIEFSSVDA